MRERAGEGVCVCGGGGGERLKECTIMVLTRALVLIMLVDALFNVP